MTQIVVLVTVYVLVLAWWLLRLDGAYDNEDFLFFQIVLGVLGLPSSLAVLLILALVDQLVPIYTGQTRITAIVIWSVMILAAYVQWFVWLPKLVAWLRGRKR